MKTITYFRAVDELGRVVLPISFRRSFNIQIKDDIEILVGDDCIFLKKYEPTCVFCGNTGELTKFKGKNICEDCLAANSNIEKK
jgi:transcriptional pleiotropic regulator of transition state genes